MGVQLSKYLKKRKIEKIKDIILNLPYSETDRSKIHKLNELEIGKTQTIKVVVKKLNFPRIRNCGGPTGPRGGLESTISTSCKKCSNILKQNERYMKKTIMNDMYGFVALGSILSALCRVSHIEGKTNVNI